MFAGILESSLGMKIYSRIISETIWKYRLKIIEFANGYLNNFMVT